MLIFVAKYVSVLFKSLFATLGEENKNPTISISEAKIQVYQLSSLQRSLGQLDIRLQFILSIDIATMVLVIEIQEIFIFEILINESEQVQDRTRALNRHWKVSKETSSSYNSKTDNVGSESCVLAKKKVMWHSFGTEPCINNTSSG